MKTALIVFMVLVGGTSYLFAQAGNHTQQETKDTPSEKCRSECHRQHCDSFSACYRIDGEKDRASCQDQVNKDERRCMQMCDNS